MRSYLEALTDGVVTGLGLALLVVAWGWLGGVPATTTGSRLFLAGLLVIAVAILIRLGDSADPPGVLGMPGDDRGDSGFCEFDRFRRQQFAGYEDSS